MSKASRTDASPWQSNGANPSTAGRGSDSPDSDDPATGNRDRPTPAERVEEFRRKYPELAFVPLSETDGRKVRRETTEADRREYEVDLKDGPGTIEQSEVVERRALPWVAGVEELLESYEQDRSASLRFAKGRPVSPDREEFEAPVENAWMPAAQRKAFAQLKALERETVGYERCGNAACGYYCESPEEHETEWVDGEYGDPVLGLLTLTASAKPGADHVPPVDFTDTRRDTWGGQDGVRRKLDDVMRRKLGLDPPEWSYWRQCEPHAGGGDNTCYGHDHILIIFDRSAVDGGLSLDRAERLLREPVDRHVERCEDAGAEAHGEDAVELKSVEGDGDGEIGNLANYMADYLSVDPDADLLERPIEYIAWAAAVWTADRNKRSRSWSAGDAVDADACKQQHRDPETRQDHDHGERLRHDDGRGPAIVCVECGSGWGVPDVETVAECRLSDDSASAGGDAVEGDGDGVGMDDAGRETKPYGRELWGEVEEYVAENPGASVAEVSGTLMEPPSKVESVLADMEAGCGPPEPVARRRKWDTYTYELKQAVTEYVEENPEASFEEVLAAMRDLPSVVESVWPEETLPSSDWVDPAAIDRVGPYPTEKFELVVKDLRREVETVLANVDVGVDPPPADGGSSVIGGSQSETVGVERPPEQEPGWEAVALVRGDGEDADVHPLGRGGVDLVPLKLPERGGSPLWERPDGARFRCDACNFATYEAGVMKSHVARHDGAAENLVNHDYPGDDVAENPVRTGPADMDRGEFYGGCERCGKEGVCFRIGGVSNCRECRERIKNDELTVVPQE